MHTMRELMKLIEGSQSNLPRLWLGPKGEVIDVEETDVAHSLYVLQHPSVFGIQFSPEEQRTYEEQGELDYEQIIARAEANGWVRTSRDMSGHSPGSVAVSASNARNLQRGIRWLLDHGYTIQFVQAEIDALLRDHIVQRYYHLDSEALQTFLRRGILPRPRSIDTVQFTT